MIVVFAMASRIRVCPTTAPPTQAHPPCHQHDFVANHSHLRYRNVIETHRTVPAMSTALLEINRTRLQPIDGVRGVTRELTGPSFSALDNKPHFFARLGCGFQASYTAP